MYNLSVPFALECLILSHFIILLLININKEKLNEFTIFTLYYSYDTQLLSKQRHMMTNEYVDEIKRTVTAYLIRCERWTEKVGGRVLEDVNGLQSAQDLG